MRRYTDDYIKLLLDKFMDGKSSLEEEDVLGEYFRTHEVRPEWDDYREMFAYFDAGMTHEPEAVKAHSRTVKLWHIAAAACLAVVCSMPFWLFPDTEKTAGPVTAVAERTIPAKAVTPHTVAQDTVVQEKKNHAKGKRQGRGRTFRDKDVEQALESVRKTDMEIEAVYDEITAIRSEVAMAYLDTRKEISVTDNGIDGVSSDKGLWPEHKEITIIQ